MSSTYWNGKGVLVARKEKKLDFSKLLGETLIIDPLPEANNDLRDLSFGLYLLGHDSCANHKISFTKQYDKSTFDIEWKGNVALSYAGDNEFKYSFEAVKNKVKFDGINMDKALTKKENEALLKMCVVDSSIFELVGNTFQLKRG